MDKYGRFVEFNAFGMELLSVVHRVGIEELPARSVDYFIWREI
jgi:hypothetical protein